MRKELEQFAKMQEQILKENDHKAGWKNCPVDQLWWAAFQELLELRDAINAGDNANIAKESCDVANFMMFIADNTSFNRNPPVTVFEKNLKKAASLVRLI